MIKRVAVGSVYMLQELEIRDFALIEHLRLSFNAGLNVLTGETGAGKSIIIDALNTVLGGKAGPSLIRTGAARAFIEGTFAADDEVIAWLKQNELYDEEFDGLVISREVTKSGSKLRINGTLVNIASVQELRHKLVTIHAQHEARTLQSGQAQLEMLDGLGDETHKKLLSQVKNQYARLKDLAAEIEQINLSEDERNRRLDFARFQLGELVDAQLGASDEDAQVAARVKMMGNVVELEGAVEHAQQLIEGGDGESMPGAADLLERAASELLRACQMDQALEPLAESLNACLESLEENKRALRKYRERLDSDPQTLETLEERLAQLATIKRKYGPTLQDAIDRQATLESDIERLQNSQLAADELQRQFDEVNEKLLAAADKLSEKRRGLAVELASRIQSELADLGMPHCQFVISFESAECGPNGTDRVEFLIAPNPGQPPAPLAKIASGGELSRVMLAVKTIFAGADRVATVIFDEIETGLSGRTLQAMRDKLAWLGRSHQILCITHQPLIACVASNHIDVRKTQTSDSTAVNASVLTHEERLKAVAGMASGKDDQVEALKFAEALFAEAARLGPPAPLPTLSGTD